jgi:hypothetical protein
METEVDLANSYKPEDLRNSFCNLLNLHDVFWII